MRTIWAVLVLLSTSLAFAQDFGHSQHGTAFDSGLRQKPWIMKGIGATHWPITTRDPKTQVWFDQGNTLLHSFWYEEAERSFRWVHKLDPDCAMAYWGLAVCELNWTNGLDIDSTSGKRGVQFLAEAVKRKSKVTEPERLMIEAWEAACAPGVKDRPETLTTKLKVALDRFPDDMEFASYYCLFRIRGHHAEENDAILKKVLARDPNHPGALHYEIHNWDRANPIKALDNALQYGRVAPNVGHAAHMPGHVLTKLGMWQEAAIAMDSATRTELHHMNTRLALPFEAWNFGHNRNYLNYIFEQLGRADAAIRGGRDLINSPRDPETNPSEGFGDMAEGHGSLMRSLTKFERWAELRRAVDSLPKPMQDKKGMAFIRGLAETGLGNLDEADKQLAILVAESPKTVERYVLEGQLMVAKRKFAEAIAALRLGAGLDGIARIAHSLASDPPADAWPVSRLLADALLLSGNAAEAKTTYEQALKQEPMDAFALAGLTKASVALKDQKAAELAVSQFRYVWANADRGLRWIHEVDALGISVPAMASTPAPERPYDPKRLRRIGPSNWAPYDAPKLEVTNTEGETVKLEDFRGKNIILVFYLSDQCVHCMEQLQGLTKRSADLRSTNTVVLAVSSASPKQNRESLKLGAMNVTLLSDRNHENARRYASYDDFENLELHSTILIDAKGKLRWKRTGGDPFTNLDFLFQEIERVNRG